MANPPGVFVENQVIWLPPIKEGVREIGDLWNCHTSKASGRSLFSGTLPPDALRSALAGSTVDFRLHHLKEARDELKTRNINGEVSVEFLAGLIKADGGFKYDNRQSSNSVEETLVLSYYEECFQVSTNDVASNAISEVALQLISSGDNCSDRPTHVVGKVLYGGEFRASIRIKSSKNDTSLLANGMAKINNVKIGPVTASGKAELAWLDKLGDYALEKTIEISCKPSIELQGPQTVENIFELVQKFQIELKRTGNEGLPPNVYGVPLQFELVPIKVFVDVQPQLLYLEIGAATLERFQNMLLVQKDYLHLDHLKSVLLRRHPHLQILFQNAGSEFSKLVSAQQMNRKNICEKYHALACEIFREYKRKLRTLEELQKIIGQFEQEFNVLDFEQQVQLLAEFGLNELGPGHQPETYVKYLTTVGQMRAWWADGKNYKLLLATTNATSNDARQKCAISTALRLASRLSFRKSNFEVGILVPSCSKDFQIKLKVQDMEEVYTERVDWTMKCFESLLVGDPWEYETRFHRLVSKCGLPLTDYSTLPHIASSCLRYSLVEFANSYYDLTRRLRNSAEKEWQFIATIEGPYSANEVARKLLSCMYTFPPEIVQDSGWILSNFGAPPSSLDFPLLFVFQGGKIRAICLDNLDILLLTQSFVVNPDSPDLTPLAVEQIHVKPLNRFRALAALELCAKLEDQRQPQPSPPVNRLQCFQERSDKNMTNALAVLRSLSQDGDAEKRQLVQLLAAEFPELASILQPLISKEWGSSDMAFVVQAKKLLTGYMRKKEPAMEVVRESLAEFRLAEYRKAEIDSLVETLPEDLKLKLTDLSMRYSFEKYVSEIPGELRWWLKEKTESKPELHAVYRLQRLIEEGVSDETRQFCEVFLAKERIPFAHEAMENQWNAQDFYGCLETLCKFRSLPPLNTLQQQLDNISPVAITTSSLKTPISKLINLSYADDFSEEMRKEIWLNPRFRKLMDSELCKDDGLVEMLGRHIGKKENVRFYLPTDTRGKLERFLEKNQPASCLKFNPKIQSLEELLDEFSRILHIGEIPPDFSADFAELLRGNDQLVHQLQDKAALPYWNDQSGHFDSPWGIDSVRRSIVACTSPPETIPEPKSKKSSGLVPPEAPNDLNFNVDIRITPKYHVLIGETQPRINTRKWTEVDEILAQPKLTAETPTPVSKVIPYTIQRVKMWGYSVLNADHISRYMSAEGGNASAPQEEKSPFANLSDSDDFCAMDFDKCGTKQKAQSSNYPLNRLDILTILLQLADPVVQEELFRILTQFPIAIPVIVPNLEAGGLYECLLPLLSNGTQKWEYGSGSERRSVENRLITDPYHLILAVRIGNSPTDGKSTILNQLFKTKYLFSSHSDPGARWGAPLSLPGAVELTWLTGDTVEGALWTEHLKPWYSERAAVILLANVHGDCFTYPAAVSLLAQLASAAVVFFMPGDKSDHFAQLKRFTTLIEPTRVEHVWVDPAYEVPACHSFYTARLTDDSNLGIIRKKIGSALQHETRHVSLASLKADNSIRMREDRLPSLPLAELIRCIETTSCEHVKSTLCLQRLQRTAAVAAWTESKSLQHIMSLFSQVLNLQLNDRVLALTHLDKTMSQISRKESEAARWDVVRHKSELNSLLADRTATDEQKAEKKEMVRIGYVNVDRKSLGLEHFFRELGRIQEIRALDTMSVVPIVPQVETENLARRYAELLVHGQSIELLNGDAGDLHSSWISAICSEACRLVPGTRIFVLSILGLQSSGKSTLLNALFACKFSVSVGRCTRGLFMRLIFLNEGLRAVYGTDAILLIDTEGLGAPEKMNDQGAETKDRLMATFAMAVSNLTLVNVLGEYLAEMKNILQIAVIALTRLEKARMSPDILIVQHLIEKSKNTSEGVTAFCNAIEAAMKLTMGEKNEGEIGVQNIKSIEKLMLRVQMDDTLKQFGTFRNGDGPSSPPSNQYHEDVVELQQKILKTARGLQEKSTFEQWHSILPDLWRAMKNENFAVRFRDIKEMSEFIHRGQGVAKVKTLVDVALYHHSELERHNMLDAFTREKQDTEGTSDSNTNDEVYNLIEKNIGRFPFGCMDNASRDNQCDKCRAVVTELNKLLEGIPDVSVNKQTDQTIGKYIRKIRTEHANTLKQCYSALVVKDGATKSFDQLIDALLKSVLSDSAQVEELIRSEQKRALKVNQIWTNVQRKVAVDRRVGNIEERVGQEVDQVFEMYTGVPKDFKDGVVHDIDQKPKQQVAPVEPQGYFATKWANLTTRFKSAVFIDSSDEARWIANELQQIPGRILSERNCNRYERGMVSSFHSTHCKNMFVQFMLHFPNTSFEITPEYKRACYLFGLSAFLKEMKLAEDAWNQDHDPLTVLLNRADQYKKYIGNRLLFGFTFGSEGKILASRIAECAAAEAKKTVERAAVQHMLQHSWILNSENVRLKYFQGMAHQVENGDKVWALKHFRNPKIAITEWFEGTLGEIEEAENYRAARFRPVYKEILESMKARIESESSCQGAIAVASKIMLEAISISYNCNADMSQVTPSDFQNFKRSFQDALSNTGDPPIPEFGPISSNKRVSERLGCTHSCRCCGSLCWGEFGHEANTDDTCKHHSSHQINGLVGTHYQAPWPKNNLLVETCDERTDESIWLFGGRKENGEREFEMPWREAKAHELYKDWKFEKHFKTEFNDLMTWFFIKLNVHIARDRGLEPPLEAEMATVKMDSNLADILLEIQNRLE